MRYKKQKQKITKKQKQTKHNKKKTKLKNDRPENSYVESEMSEFREDLSRSYVPQNIQANYESEDSTETDNVYGRGKATDDGGGNVNNNNNNNNNNKKRNESESKENEQPQTQKQQSQNKKLGTAAQGGVTGTKDTRATSFQSNNSNSLKVDQTHANHQKRSSLFDFLDPKGTGKWPDLEDANVLSEQGFSFFFFFFCFVFLCVCFWYIYGKTNCVCYKTNNKQKS